MERMEKEKEKEMKEDNRTWIDREPEKFLGLLILGAFLLGLALGFPIGLLI